jgi:hypothetical protein
MKKSNEVGGWFTAVKALRDYRDNKDRWTGGALIVACEGSGFQAIPGAYLTDASYTGSRQAIELAAVRAAAKLERKS